MSDDRPAPAPAPEPTPAPAPEPPSIGPLFTNGLDKNQAGIETREGS